MPCAQRRRTGAAQRHCPVRRRSGKKRGCAAGPRRGPGPRNRHGLPARRTFTLRRAPSHSGRRVHTIPRRPVAWRVRAGTGTSPGAHGSGAHSCRSVRAADAQHNPLSPAIALSARRSNARAPRCPCPPQTPASSARSRCPAGRTPRCTAVS